MDGDDIVWRRLHNQHLWGAPLGDAEAVVRWLAAMQSQELAVARWSISQRAGDVGVATIDRALADGAILRTHIIRPTWHFVLPADLRWLLALSAPRVHALNAYSYRILELDDALLIRTNALLAGAVADGRHGTRQELAGVLEGAGISASGLRLAYILMRAELDAVLCSGAPRGKQQTYAAFDERVPPSGMVDRDAALAELTRRYFVGRGPATLKDYVRWSSLTVADGKRGLGLVAAELERESVDGRTYWFAPTSPGMTPRPAAHDGSPVIDLLQGYDEYVMAYSESKDLLLGHGRPEVAMPFTHAILLDGQVIGHWRPVLTSRAVAVETSLNHPLDGAAAAALDAAATRYGRFLGLLATLR